MSVRIMTDSASDMSLEELEANRVTLIPMDLQVGDETITDDKTYPVERLWDRMEAGEQIRTSQPSPARFEEAFSKALDQGEEVVCLLLSSALSGTCQSAVLGKSLVNGPVEIVDCTCAAASVAEKLVVLEACRLRDKGLSAREIAVKVTAFRSRVRLIACLNTLDYLARGGRISRAVANIGGLARIKPIIDFTDKGEVHLASKVIGSRHALRAMVSSVVSQRLDPSVTPVPIYSRTDEYCQTYIAALAEAGLTRLAQPQGIGATIGAYIGPGAYGLVYVVAE